jgi:hypothetical protein
MARAMLRWEAAERFFHGMAGGRPVLARPWPMRMGGVGLRLSRQDGGQLSDEGGGGRPGGGRWG